MMTKAIGVSVRPRAFMIWKRGRIKAIGGSMVVAMKARISHPRPGKRKREKA